MPERAANRGEVFAGLQRQCGERVAEVMEASVWQAEPSQRPLEGQRDVHRVEWCSGGRRGDKARQRTDGLPLSMGGERPGGPIKGLRPVYVPGLDGTEADVLVGPSSGFRWAEDGTYTLQAVRPAQAGQDIGLAGIVWLAPIEGGAFTRCAAES